MTARGYHGQEHAKTVLANDVIDQTNLIAIAIRNMALAQDPEVQVRTAGRSTRAKTSSRASWQSWMRSSLRRKDAGS